MDQVPPCSKMHSCCKADQEHSCELVTLTASQASSFFIFVMFIILDFIATFNGHYGINPKKDTEESGKAIITILMLLASLTAWVYYFLGTWIAEEDLIDDLRKINIVSFYFQWIIRVGIIGIFALYTTMESNWIVNTFHVEYRYQFVNLYTCLLFACSFLWDLVVLFGGGWKIVKKFIFIDFAGFAILYGLYYSLLSDSAKTTGVLTFLYIVLAVLMIVTLHGYKGFSTFMRLGSPKKLR